MKGFEGAEVAITRKTMVWMERYRSLKELLLKENADSKDSWFFVNHNGAALSDIANTRGSIWQKFEQVTGVTKATITSCVRAAAAQIIQDNPEMANRVQSLNNHSAAVESSIYDRNKYQYRGQFVNFMSVKEGEGSSNLEEEEDEQLTQRRKEREQEDDKSSKEDAAKILKSLKVRKKTALSSQCRVKPLDRQYIQGLIQSSSHPEFIKLRKKKLPGIKK